MPNGERRQVAVVGLGETGRRIVDTLSQQANEFSERILPLTAAGMPAPSGYQIVVTGPDGHRSAFAVPPCDWRRGSAADYLKLHFSAIQEQLAVLVTSQPRLLIVCGSLADPWAACLIDLAARVRSLTVRPRLPLVAVMTMRTGGDEASGQRAACYAALKELQYFQDGKLAEADASIVSRRGRGARPALRDGLFDRVFVVPDAGMDGAPDMDSHAAIMAISQEIRSTIEGDDALLKQATGPAAKCNPKHASFGTFGVARLRFPTVALQDYCALRAELALIKRLLTGENPTQEDRLEDDEFLLSQDIGSPNGTVKLVEALARNAADTGGIVTSILTTQRASGQASAMDQLANDETELRRHVLPLVQEAVRANAERELAARMGALREWTHYVFVNRGLSEATAFLSRFENGVLAAIETIERERDDWERRRRDIEERLAACWSEFRGQKAISALFARGRRVELEAHIRDCHDTLAREESYDVAREQAGTLLLAGLVEYGGSLQDTLRAIAERLAGCQAAVTGRLAAVAAPEDSSLLSDGFPTLFDRFFPGTQSLVERLLGDSDDLIAFLSGMPVHELEEILFQEGNVDFASNIGSLGVLDSWAGNDLVAGLDRLLACARAQLATVPPFGGEEIALLTAGVAAGQSAVAAGVVSSQAERAAEPEIRDWLTANGARHAGGGRNDEIICSVVRTGFRPGCIGEAALCRADYESADREQDHVFARYVSLPAIGVAVFRPKVSPTKERKPETGKPETSKTKNSKRGRH